MPASPRVSPRVGALLTLVSGGVLTAVVLGVTPADATPRRGAATAPLSVVQTHTWAQGPGADVAANAAQNGAMQPTGTWIDGVHGPVLDGALLSTPMLVLLLVAVAAGALFMAARTALALGDDAPASAVAHTSPAFARGATTTSTTRASGTFGGTR